MLNKCFFFSFLTYGTLNTCIIDFSVYKIPNCRINVRVNDFPDINCHNQQLCFNYALQKLFFYKLFVINFTNLLVPE